VNNEFERRRKATAVSNLEFCTSIFLHKNRLLAVFQKQQHHIQVHCEVKKLGTLYTNTILLPSFEVDTDGALLRSERRN
jgi:hypothetical protein